MTFRVNDTMMNAFLFNAFILALASFGVVELCADAFGVYNRFTALDST